MTRSATKPKSRQRRLNVGDRVKLRFGDRDVVAEIVEDRGRIGYGGRRLLRVRMLVRDGTADEFEVAEEDVRAA